MREQKQLYPNTAWKRTDKDNQLIENCMMCMAKHKADGIPCQCTACWSWLPADAFPEHHRSWQSSHNCVCVGCVDQRVCKQCNVLRCDYEFTDMDWEHAAWPASRSGRCKGCMRKSQRHMWHCAGCNETKLAPQEFSEWLEGRLCQGQNT